MRAYLILSWQTNFQEVIEAKFHAHEDRLFKLLQDSLNGRLRRKQRFDKEASGYQVANEVELVFITQHVQLLVRLCEVTFHLESI